MATTQTGRFNAREVADFAVVWLAVGFATGTVTLLGPVRWVTTALRDGGSAELTERLAVLAIIVTYVALSFGGAMALHRVGQRAAGWRRFVPVGCAWAAAIACLWLWMTPAVVNGFQPVQVDTVERFTFGPYPERERFEQLKADGYTAIVSLLHPAVVPFEPTLLARERALADEFGIEFIHAPMLPWIGDNEASLALLREVAQRDHGRYYVHCYLGRDRVGTVRNLIARAGAAVASGPVVMPVAREFTKDQFERGAVREIDEGVFLSPYPTDEEMFAYIAGGAFANVVSLLDPENPDDVQWIEKERKVADDYGVSLHLIPVSWMKYDPAAALAAAARVRDMPRPVLVHAFRSEGVAAEAFLAAYNTGLPPVSRRGFEGPLAGGQAVVVATNVVVGPRPAGPEFGTVLKRRGIRGVVYVGDPGGLQAQHDKVVAETEAGLVFRAMAADVETVATTVSQAGPWYVYGPGLAQVRQSLVGRLGGKNEGAMATAAAAGR